MNAVVFADTLYWIALTYSEDAAHHRATVFDVSPKRPLVLTTEEILVEFLTFFGGKGSFLRGRAVTVARRFLADRKISVLRQSHDTFAAGLELYAARMDKAYSLTDCIAMAIMRREGITEILTDDRHFEQEGFRALFRS